MVTWYPLVFACPAKNCPRTSTEAYTWQCATCKTPAYISEEGYIRCETYRHTSQLINCSFNCGRHAHSADYQPPDLQGFSFAMSYALQLMDRAGSKWTAALMLAVGKQFGK